jgi:hypothetical protein
VHLGDAEALADLGLGQVPVEAQVQDPLLAFGQVVQVGTDGLHVDGVLDRLVVLAEQLGHRRGILGVGDRRVQRGGGEGEAGPAGLADVVLGDPQQAGQLVVGGRAAAFLGQLPADRADLEQQFLERAADVDLPALVPEVPLDLAADTRRGVSRQAVSQAGSKLPIALTSARYPTCIRSSAGSGLARYGRTQARTRWA